MRLPFRHTGRGNAVSQSEVEFARRRRARKHPRQRKEIEQEATERTEVLIPFFLRSLRYLMFKAFQGVWGFGSVRHDAIKSFRGGPAGRILELEAARTLACLSSTDLSPMQSVAGCVQGVIAGGVRSKS